jgi:chemotaxis protein MotA
MSLATIIGLLAGFALVVAAMVLGGSPSSFVDGPAMLIVIGGTFAVTLASFSFRELASAVVTTVRALFQRAMNPQSAAYVVLELADQARRHGVVGLQSEAEKLSDEPFLAKAVSLVVDGTPSDDIDRLLQQEISVAMQRRLGSADVFRRAAEVAPAMGLIGTLVGLVQMLSNLDDPSSIGPAMAIALLTTFYGAVLAYMVFAPLAARLERDSDEAQLVNSVFALGATSIGRKENPRRLEMLLNATLPPAQRVHYFD